MQRSLSYDAMEIDCDIGVSPTIPNVNMESPPPRREPPPLQRPVRPSTTLFDETDRTTLSPESSGSFVTMEVPRHTNMDSTCTIHTQWHQLCRGHHIEHLDLDSDLEHELVISNAGDHTPDQNRETTSDANMGILVPYEVETESTRGESGVHNNNTDHDETNGVGSVSYDASGPPWLPIERSESEFGESEHDSSISSPYESRYIDDNETLVFIRFGFHYCEQCIPLSDPPTAECSTCRAPLRGRRLVCGPIEGFHEYQNYPGPRYFHHARHNCDTCWLTGVCDMCGYFLRDFRPV